MTISINKNTIPSTRIGAIYSHQIQLTGAGNGKKYKYNATQNAGLAVSEDGLISGTLGTALLNIPLHVYVWELKDNNETNWLNRNSDFDEVIHVIVGQKLNIIPTAEGSDYLFRINSGKRIVDFSLHENTPGGANVKAEDYLWEPSDLPKGFKVEGAHLIGSGDFGDFHGSSSFVFEIIAKNKANSNVNTGKQSRTIEVIDKLSADLKVSGHAVVGKSLKAQIVAHPPAPDGVVYSYKIKEGQEEILKKIGNLICNPRSGEVVCQKLSNSSGKHNVKFIISDNLQYSCEISAPIDIVLNDSFRFVTPHPPAQHVIAGQVFTASAKVCGGVPPYTYEVKAKHLYSRDIIINADGIFSGTVPEFGDVSDSGFDVTIKAHDDIANVVEQKYNFKKGAKIRKHQRFDEEENWPKAFLNEPAHFDLSDIADGGVYSIKGITPNIPGMAYRNIPTTKSCYIDYTPNQDDLKAGKVSVTVDLESDFDRSKIKFDFHVYAQRFAMSANVKQYEIVSGGNAVIVPLKLSGNSQAGDIRCLMAAAEKDISHAVTVAVDKRKAELSVSLAKNKAFSKFDVSCVAIDFDGQASNVVRIHFHQKSAK